MLNNSFTKGTPEGRKYVVRTMAFMSGYVAVNVMAIFGAFDEIIGRPIAWGLALAVAAPVIGQIWATLALLKTSDEFVRGMLTKVFVIATGLTLAVCTVWGFGESYAGAPHIPAWIAYPVFWACFGLVSPFVRTSEV
ncbi:MAG: hypothetical protein Q8S03_01130 [Brevundimonas sp.]|uniref:hypothetical protein n=1 Tax=Brevundimonas sp. TaxID=1871086 RepID=UPI002732924B|nr:hypothetical protein [Brevundimonas sp.]MDP3403258.1 hypothetical protein [Brevundimonas sp.]